MESGNYVLNTFDHRKWWEQDVLHGLFAMLSHVADKYRDILSKHHIPSAHAH
jgi:hypothetical protein